MWPTLKLQNLKKIVKKKSTNSLRCLSICGFLQGRRLEIEFWTEDIVFSLGIMSHCDKPRLLTQVTLCAILTRIYQSCRYSGHPLPQLHNPARMKMNLCFVYLCRINKNENVMNFFTKKQNRKKGAHRGVDVCLNGGGCPFNRLKPGTGSGREARLSQPSKTTRYLSSTHQHLSTHTCIRVHVQQHISPRQDCSFSCALTHTRRSTLDDFELVSLYF